MHENHCSTSPMSSQNFNMQVNVPDSKIVGQEMTISVNLPSGEPVNITLQPEVQPNQTIIVPIKENKRNNAYVYPMESGKVDYDNALRTDTYQPFSKEVLLKEMSTTMRRAIKWFGVLNQEKLSTKIFKWVGIVVAVVYMMRRCILDFRLVDGIPTHVFHIFGVINATTLWGAQTLGMFYIYEMFKDGGEFFYQMWMTLSTRDKKSVNSFAFRLTTCYLCFYVVLALGGLARWLGCMADDTTPNCSNGHTWFAIYNFFFWLCYLYTSSVGGLP